MTATNSSGKDGDYVIAERTHRVIYTLMTRRYATKYELDNVYTIEDVLDMYEACLVYLHNQVASLQK